MPSVLGALDQIGVVPVITIDRPDDAAPLARALVAGELPGILVGAGTVLSVAQAEQAIAAGARYIVAPGFDPALVDWCRARDVPVLPGMATPTEVTMALAHGVRLLKFFPAEESGGVRMLRVLYAPFRDMWTERQGEQDIPLSLELSNS